MLLRVLAQLVPIGLSKQRTVTMDNRGFGSGTRGMVTEQHFIA